MMDDGSGSEFAEEGTIVRTNVGNRSLVRCYGALGKRVAELIEVATSMSTVAGLMTKFALGAGAGAVCSYL